MQGCILLTTVAGFNNRLVNIDLSAFNWITFITLYNNILININANWSTITRVDIQQNKLTAIPTLTSKYGIVEYDFTYNNLPTAELNRLRALGFTDEYKLLPQNP